VTIVHAGGPGAKWGLGAAQAAPDASSIGRRQAGGLPVGGTTDEQAVSGQRRASSTISDERRASSTISDERRACSTINDERRASSTINDERRASSTINDERRASSTAKPETGARLPAPASGKWADYSYAHGGKDGFPFPVDRTTYDQSIHILPEAVRKARIGETEKAEALKRLSRLTE